MCTGMYKNTCHIPSAPNVCRELIKLSPSHSVMWTDSSGITIWLGMFLLLWHASPVDWLTPPMKSVFENGPCHTRRAQHCVCVGRLCLLKFISVPEERRQPASPEQSVRLCRSHRAKKKKKQLRQVVNEPLPHCVSPPSHAVCLRILKLKVWKQS